MFSSLSCFMPDCVSRRRMAANPPELCGYWFFSGLSVERRMGHTQARRELGLGTSTHGDYAWVIIDEEAQMTEWCEGRAEKGKDPRDSSFFRGEVAEWGKEAWKCHRGPTLKIEDKEYLEIQGQQVLVAFAANGRRLERTYCLHIGDQSLYALNSEAEAFPWHWQCLEAILERNLVHFPSRNLEAEKEHESDRAAGVQGSQMEQNDSMAGVEKGREMMKTRRSIPDSAGAPHS